MGASVSREQFTVYASVVHRLADFEVDAVIIGASYILTITRPSDKLVLSEIFSCGAAPPIELRPLGSIEGKLIDHPTRWLDMAYQFRAKRLPWNVPEEPNELVKLIAAAHSSDGVNSFGLVQGFPQGNLPVTPKTVVYGRAEGDQGVVIETAHTYPLSGLVLSRTILLRKGG